MTEKPSGEDSPEPLSFEDALARLEGIVENLEDGEIGLAQGLAEYEQGVKLLKQCYQLLGQAQSRIELLNRVDSDGTTHSEPFDEGTPSLEEKAQSRARRRSRASGTAPEDDPDAIDGPGRLF